MAKTRISVATQFVIGYLLGSLLVAGLIIHHLVSDAATQLTHEVTKKGEAVTRLFARNLVNPLYHLDVDWMQNAIGHVQTLEDVREVLVFNEAAMAITDGTVANPRLGESVPGAAEVIASRPDRPRVVTEPERLRFTLPVMLGDKILGGVRLDLSLSTARAKTARMLSELVVLAAALILLGALPVWLVTHFLIKPLVFGDA